MCPTIVFNIVDDRRLMFFAASIVSRSRAQIFFVLKLFDRVIQKSCASRAIDRLIGSFIRERAKSSRADRQIRTKIGRHRRLSTAEKNDDDDNRAFRQLGFVYRTVQLASTVVASFEPNDTKPRRRRFLSRLQPTRTHRVVVVVDCCRWWTSSSSSGSYHETHIRVGSRLQSSFALVIGRFVEHAVARPLVVVVVVAVVC